MHPDPSQLLELVALVAGTAVGLTLVVRRLPPVAGWVEAQIKPWSCNVCCATWSTLGLAVTLSGATQDAWNLATWLPSLAIATWGLNHADPPPPPDFGLAPEPLEADS